jgi:hypothetical protein
VVLTAAGGTPELNVSLNEHCNRVESYWFDTSLASPLPRCSVVNVRADLQLPVAGIVVKADVQAVRTAGT